MNFSFYIIIKRWKKEYKMNIGFVQRKNRKSNQAHKV